MKLINRVEFTNWHELGIAVAVAALTQAFMVLVNLNAGAVTSWRDWLIAALVGIGQAGARAGLALLVASAATQATPQPVPDPVPAPGTVTPTKPAA